MPDSAGAALQRIAEADRALALATEAADAVKLVAQGKALAKWAEAVHAGVEHARMAQLFVVRAMRNAGQRLAEAQERGEVAGRGDIGQRFGRDVADDDISRPATLAEVGVTRDQASDWKRLAQEYPTDDALVEALEDEARPSLTKALHGRAPTEAERAFAEPILKEVIAERWMDPLYAVVDDLRAAVEWAQQESFGLRRRDHINQMNALVAEAGRLVNTLEDTIRERAG